MSVPVRDALWLAGVVAWLVLLMVACLAPVQGPSLLEFPQADKLAHALLFAAGSLWLAWRLRPWLILPALLALGLLIEYLQALTPTRNAEWLDWLADAAGVLIGLGMARLLWPGPHPALRATLSPGERVKGAVAPGEEGRP